MRKAHKNVEKIVSVCIQNEISFNFPMQQVLFLATKVNGGFWNCQYSAAVGVALNH